MPEILVRNLDKKTIDRLKKRAKKGGRSLQAEVKSILEQAAKLDMESARRLVDRIRVKCKDRKSSDSVELIREDRER